ncbi:restriction endonuclease subunit S [Streptococcus sp. HMSC056C01]|uniref:restriction endonuclease subunit S n=1 Tax=Streptococcus sp. HMSC056C01 TaxID=1739299 RepID=UPI0008B6EB97|nr:restriction endonuclease subunit S [Streptococcus sp. HMSC056C01]OFK85664.1 hypothetical protein HMPREF2795_08795 [Streptococcus sp. HMSC056C01]
MTPQQLKNAILQQAIQGKLVEQRAEEGTGEELYKAIQDEKQKLIQEGKLKKQKALPEIAADDIPFEIPETWKWVRLGDLSKSVQYGYNAPAKNEGRIKMVRISDIQDDSVCWDTVPYCDIREEEIEQYLLKNNDILFARTGGTVGKSFLVKNISENAIYAGYLIRTQYGKNIVPQFLKYFMGSELYWSQLRIGTIATAQPNCNGQTLSKMILPLPPLAEQKRIVEKIEELLPLVERYEKAWARLEELNKKFPLDMQKAILGQAIQGKLVKQRAEEGTSQELYKAIQDEKQKLIQEGKLKKQKALPEITEEEIPFEIPETWKWVRLGDIVNFSIGKTPPRAEAEWWGNDLPWVSISDMSDYGFIKSTKEKVSKKAVKEKFVKTVSKEILLMSFKLTVGRTSILKIDAVHNEAIISIVPLVDNKYSFRDMLFYVLPIISQWGESKNAIKGKTLNTTSINNLLIPLPPLAEQKRIVEKIEELLPLVEKLK